MKPRKDVLFLPYFFSARGGGWILFVFFALIFISSTSFAQAGQAGLEIDVLKAGVGARALGMGGAFTAVADNADCPYWNPAGLGWASQREITTMQTRLSTDANHYYVSYINPLWGGSLGVSWIQVGLGTIAQTSSEVTSNNEVQTLSQFSYFSNAYVLSYGKQISQNLSFGLSGKYLSSDMYSLSGGQAYGYSFTPGILLRLPLRGNQLRLGLKFDELVNQTSWATGTTEQAPCKLRLGFAYKTEKLGLLALDVSQIIKNNYGPEGAVGYEWQNAGLSLRAGYQPGGITAGAGFRAGHSRVDYAYVTQQALSRQNLHRVSLSGIW